MIVPFNQSPATSQARGVPVEASSSVFLAMAAAQMHAQGRLFALNEDNTVEKTPDEIAAGVRRDGEGRIDPEYPPVKELLKKLPSDIEYEPGYSGGPRLKLKKKTEEVPTS